MDFGNNCYNMLIATNTTRRKQAKSSQCKICRGDAADNIFSCTLDLSKKMDFLKYDCCWEFSNDISKNTKATWKL